jgi:carboxyl-terminal processing protease
MKHFVSKKLICKIALCLCLAIAFAATAFAQDAGAADSQPARTDLEKREESFQIVWQTVNDLFYDPKFGGVDWQAARNRYHPQVALVKNDAEFHSLLQRMLNELHQSHFIVVPREAIPKIRVDVRSDDDTPASGPDTTEPEDPLDTLSYKLADRMLTGIGIDLRVLEGSAVVTRVEPGSAAARAGLKPGFVIKKVGGRSMDVVISDIEKHPLWGSIIRPELPVFLVAGFINGEDRSSVRLGYLDARNRLRMINIKRERLKGEMSMAIGNLPSMYTEFEARRLPDGVGYIRFNAFVPPLMEKLCGALRSMKDAPGVILDLRGNQGGLLGMVGGLTGLLETTPTFMGTLKTRNSYLPLIVAPQAVPYSGPLIILVDGSTQSAGEMFASGLQETGRAILVGEKTAGNTLPSAIKKLPTGAIFQYGFANYETRSGKTLEGLGVMPDVPVRLSRRTLLRGVDPQLNAARSRLSDEIRWRTVPQIIADVATNAPASPPEKKTIVQIAEPPPAPAPEKLSLSGPPLIDGPEPSTVTSILEHAVAASGGKSAFDKLKNRVSTGTVELTALGMTATFEMLERQPNSSSLIVEAPGLGTMQKTFDGKRAWLQDPLQGFISLGGIAQEIARENAIFNRQGRLNELYSHAVLIGKETIDNKQVYVVRMGLEKWYFEVESGLLVRKGNVFYDDYREVDGVKLPFKIREEVIPGAAALYSLKSVKHNVAIDEAKFLPLPSCFTKP